MVSQEELVFNICHFFVHLIPPERPQNRISILSILCKGSNEVGNNLVTYIDNLSNLFQELLAEAPRFSPTRFHVSMCSEERHEAACLISSQYEVFVSNQSPSCFISHHWVVEEARNVGPRKGNPRNRVLQKH